MEQAEIFVFIASFFLIALGFKEPEKPTPPPPPLDELPPIILFPESSKFKFASGQAELNPDFKTYISNELAKEILRVTQQHDVDAIEVIGHTDGQPIGSVESNLDDHLEKVNLNQLPLSELQPASNTDLGIMRALAVVQELKKSGKEISKLNFRAYSAGQLLLEDGSPAPVSKEDNPQRRRIEIRFTKLGETTTIK
jgi:outer membrane protein OmpA-like peptidoglycan-associated protein